MRNRLIINEMKKKVVGYMTIGLLAVAMMVQAQAQPASRQDRSLPLRDSIERMGPMNRMGAMGGPRMGAVRPGQFGQRDSVRAQAPLRRMQRGGALSEPGNRMQRSGALSAPGNRGPQRGGVAPGFGLRSRQGGLQGGMQGRPQGGLQRGLQSGRSADPEKRIENEVEQLKQLLDLSADQVKKITDIKKKQAKKEIKAYKKSQKKLEARRKKAEAPNDKIKSVLTEEQVKKFESSRPRSGSSVRPGAGPGLRPGAGPGPGVGPRSGSDSNRFGGAGFGGRRL